MAKAKKRKYDSGVKETRTVVTLDNTNIMRLLRERLAYPEPGDDLLDASLALDLISLIAAKVRLEQYQGKDNYR
jgi:hypothetical protein